MFVVLGCFSVDVKVGYQKDFKAFEGVQDLLFCFSRLILPPHPLLINSVCVWVCVCVCVWVCGCVCVNPILAAYRANGQ